MAIEPVTHLEKTIAGTVEPVTHLEKVIAEHGGGGGGGSVTSVNGKTGAVTLTAADLDDSFKDALLDCFANVAWATEDGQQYYDALEAALYPPADLLSISAVFEQGETVIYDTDGLDALRPMLTVTANFDNGMSKTVTDYTLSGTLTEGTSTITVSYGGKTATFDVVVSAQQFNTGYTEIGAPTVTDGILKVENGKFVKSNVVFSPGDSGWRITCKARATGSAPAEYADVFGSVDANNASVRSLLVEMNGMDMTGAKGAIFLSSNNSAWDIATTINAFTLTQSIYNWTWMELAYDGSQYTFKASTDGTTFETLVTVTSAAKVYGGFAVGFGLNRNGYLNGEIDLNECKIYIDGALYWKAIA